MPSFQNSTATVKFLRTFDHLFDIFNSRNPLGKYYQSPLRKANENAWRPFLKDAAKYIEGLKDTNGTPMHMTRRKTGFLGFLSAIKSVQCLFDELVGNPDVSMKYLLTYKLSQDHLELFFSAVRSCGGWNNNPTVKQFMASYKRLLLRHQVKASGNCSIFDDTNILHVVKDDISLNSTTTDIVEISTIRRYDLEVRPMPLQSDHDYTDIPNFNSLSSFKTAAVGYIAGFVINMVKKVIHCHVCLAVLTTKGTTMPNQNLLVKHKSKGGLIEASASVLEICENTERCLTRMLHVTKGELPRASHLISAIQSVIVEETVQKGVFLSLHDHMFDCSPENNHLFSLIKCVSSCFLKVRMHHLAKEKTTLITGGNIRKKLSKLILFKNQ